MFHTAYFREDGLKYLPVFFGLDLQILVESDISKFTGSWDTP